MAGASELDARSCFPARADDDFESFGFLGTVPALLGDAKLLRSALVKVLECDRQRLDCAVRKGLASSRAEVARRERARDVLISVTCGGGFGLPELLAPDRKSVV